MTLFTEGRLQAFERMIEARKQAIRTEDIARGVFIPVSSLPQLGPRKGA